MLVRNGEISLNVRDDGAGTPVVLLHGWPDTGDLWAHQIHTLGTAGYRTIAPDLRGFGDSSKPTDLPPYALTEHVRDVVAILDALDIPAAHVVGHDWGAAIAWRVAAFAPDRVSSLTALSTGHPASFATAGTRQRELSWYMLLFQFTGVAEEWLSADDFHNLRTLMAHPRADEVVRRLSVPGALTASLAIYRANLPPESLIAPRRQLPPITAPAMGVWSSRDGALTEKNMTGSAAYVKGPWRYERIEDAGHWIPLDAPAKLDALLLDFLATAAK
ncbi:alpha/beta hydrolase [Actinoplanes sp. TBRC 11911]|uniref:alpha/beta fold hydrolase n=1 Tax=Actinoplanes sp. TBRC 11911 TaxID=2729386 RepID=UPI00145D5880|nr:alpha/beta hydrolase [Actinoplanes sp. TBRC 11911]NMO50025.1 alpha/beta hydrolase [Actinoplanes sp. TBRC 11911]